MACVLVGRMIAPLAAEGDERTPLRLTLPPTAYAVVGSEIGVDFDNIVLTESPTELRFVVTCDIGRSEATRWSVTPAAADVREHAWRVEVFRDDRRIADGSMTYHVSPATSRTSDDKTLLLVGDSLTHASVYANDLSKRLAASGATRWTFLGTHRPAGAQPGVAHEGYGGWTWARFVTHYEPNPNPAERKHSSPFVFLAEADQKPRLDVDRYLRESCGGRTPDYVLFLLGINDCFSANPDSLEEIDERIDRVFEHAETLLAAFRAAAPHAELGVCLTTPPNARESGFEANYKGRYTRWGWKRIQHRLVERQLQQFTQREREQIFVVPTELNLDPFAGYPDNNGVHPNARGYQQIAASMHAWLMARVAAESRNRD